MTNDEKFTAIVERLKAEGWIDNPNIVSTMVIIDYLDKLEKEKLIECGFALTPAGRKIAAITDEFDWKVSDTDIQNFVNEMIAEPDRLGFIHMIKRFRDDREGFMEEITKYRAETNRE